MLLRQVSLYRRLFWSSDSVLRDVFTIYSLNNYSDDNMLYAVSVKADVAYERVYDRFYMLAS